MARPQPISEHRPGRPLAWRATGLERPVFLDESGRRGRVVRLGGVAAALLVATWLGLVVAGPFGFAHLPTAAAPAFGRHLHAANVARGSAKLRDSRARAPRGVPVQVVSAGSGDERS